MKILKYWVGVLENINISIYYKLKTTIFLNYSKMQKE